MDLPRGVCLPPVGGPTISPPVSWLLAVTLPWHPPRGDVQECARYLETFKAFESKPADLIQGRAEEDYLSRLNAAVTTVCGPHLPAPPERLLPLLPGPALLRQGCEGLELCGGGVDFDGCQLVPDRKCCCQWGMAGG